MVPLIFEVAPEGDTFPKLVRRNAEKIPGKVAIREKNFGIWQSFTWRDYYEQSRLIALGLASLGLRRGDMMAVVGDNRPQLYWAMTAAQSIGGIPVPLFQDSIEAEMQFIIDHAEVKIAVVEDQEQVDKLLHIKEKSAHIEYIVYEESRGMRHYDHPFLMSLEELQERGEKFDRENPSYFEEESAKVKTEDVAVILYTSGTTGDPKGTMLCHGNLILAAGNAIAREGLREDEEVLAYLPMAWVGDHTFSYAQSILTGFAVNCPESAATVLHDLKEIGPTYFFAPPRIWENILTALMIRIDNASWIKRRMTHFFLDLAQDLERARLNRQPSPLWRRLLYPFGRFLVYGPLKDNLGMGAIRIAYTAGEAIGPEIFGFFRGLGINVKQLYGMTESSALVCIQRDGDVKLDTVGPPLPGVEIRITEEGEVLYRCPGVFKGYYKDPETTKATLEDGWVHSGDAGFLDNEGHLKIIDRAKDVSRLQGGTIFAPKYIENKLKFSPYIKEAVCFGQDRSYVTALINIDLTSVGDWAERRNLAYTSYMDLSQKPEINDLISLEVIRVNQSLLEDDVLRDAQIRKYLILYKELDPDDEEITRTRKVRRGFIAEKYATLIDSLYSDLDSVEVEAQVTYEDGRTAMMNAKVRIREVEVFAGGGAP